MAANRSQYRRNHALAERIFRDSLQTCQEKITGTHPSLLRNGCRLRIRYESRSPKALRSASSRRSAVAGHLPLVFVPEMHGVESM